MGVPDWFGLIPLALVRSLGVLLYFRCPPSGSDSKKANGEEFHTLVCVTVSRKPRIVVAQSSPVLRLVFRFPCWHVRVPHVRTHPSASALPRPQCRPFCVTKFAAVLPRLAFGVPYLIPRFAPFVPTPKSKRNNDDTERTMISR